MLHGRASLRPDDVAFTFTDYVHDPAGVSESLTWSQLSRRTLNVARELSLHASVGDRAVILAPQSLDYIAAFLGSMQAGLIAVPLPLPHRGSSHDRVSAVFADTSPSVVLTTSAVAEDIAEYRRSSTPGRCAEDRRNRFDESGRPDGGPSCSDSRFSQHGVFAVQLGFDPAANRGHDLAPQPSGEFRAADAQLFRGLRTSNPPPDATIVSWLPFYHDMGLVLGVCAPILGGFRAELTSPVAFLERPARWMRALAENSHAFSAAPNFAFDLAARKTTDSDLAGLDLGGVLGIISGAERVEPATLERFADRFAHFNFRDHMLRPSYGLAEATVFVAAGTWSDSSEAVHFDVDELSAGRAQRCAAGAGSALVRYKLPQSPVVRIVDVDTNRRMPAGRGRRDLGAWRQCRGRLLEQATGGAAVLRRNARRPFAGHA